MATIEENLQTLKDSIDAIKQAIIDKGGDVSGDITTWAGSINAIESGGQLDLITFYIESSSSRICPRGMTWAEYVESVFNTRDYSLGLISIGQNDRIECSQGSIMNPDTNGNSYSHETIYPQMYVLIHGSGSGGSDN